MKIYKTKVQRLTGDRYSEVHKKAFHIYAKFKKHTKRRTYVRSAYFSKQKVFLGLFWHHLEDKFSFKEKIRRLQYFPCALDLIAHSRFAPESKQNVDKKSEILHRFIGETAKGEMFFVQIKENKNNDQKFLISVFPKQ